MERLKGYYDPELVAAATAFARGKSKLHLHALNNFLAVYKACTGFYGNVKYASEDNARSCTDLLRRWVAGTTEDLTLELRRN